MRNASDPDARLATLMAPMAKREIGKHKAEFKEWLLKQDALNLTERFVLYIIADRCRADDPWAWVQLTTRIEWAECWGMDDRTLRRTLTSLQEKGALTMVKETNPVGAWAPGRYPVARVSEQFLRQYLSSRGERYLATNIRAFSPVNNLWITTPE
jgi:hypothetical protein